MQTSSTLLLYCWLYVLSLFPCCYLCMVCMSLLFLCGCLFYADVLHMSCGLQPERCCRQERRAEARSHAAGWLSAARRLLAGRRGRAGRARLGKARAKGCGRLHVARVRTHGAHMRKSDECSSMLIQQITTSELHNSNVSRDAPARRTRSTTGCNWREMIA